MPEIKVECETPDCELRDAEIEWCRCGKWPLPAMTFAIANTPDQETKFLDPADAGVALVCPICHTGHRFFEVNVPCDHHREELHS